MEFRKTSTAIERFILIVLVALLSILLLKFRMNNLELRHFDQVAFAQLLDSIRLHGIPSSSIFSSVLNVIVTAVKADNFDDYITMISNFDVNEQKNFLKFHSYFILYLLWPLTYAVSSETAILILQLFCFIGPPVIAYLWVRHLGAGVVAALFFAVAVLLHPALSAGFLWDFYPDRLFVPLALLAFICLSGRRWALAVLFFALAASVTERAPSILGAFLVGYSFAAIANRNVRSAAIFFLCGIGLVGMGFLLQFYFIDNLFYQGGFMPTSLSNLIARFSSDIFRGKLWILLAVNALFLFLSALNPRFIPLILAVMMPNIVGYFHGAEKSGFYSHYHSYYLPALIWSAALGYRKLVGLLIQFNASHRPHARYGIAILLALSPLALAPHLIDWSNHRRIAWSWALLSSSHVVFKAPALWREAYARPFASTRQARRDVRAAFPPGSVISTVDSAVWALPVESRIFAYPVGLAEATHLAVQCDPSSPDRWKAGTMGFSGHRPDELQERLGERARAMGFDVDNVQCTPLWIGIIRKTSVR